MAACIIETLICMYLLQAAAEMISILHLK